jgi:hypothetical protein
MIEVPDEQTSETVKHVLLGFNITCKCTRALINFYHNMRFPESFPDYPDVDFDDRVIHVQWTIKYNGVENAYKKHLVMILFIIRCQGS